MDDGGFVELKAAHRELDLAVADAYGWNSTMLDDPVRLLEALFALNAQSAVDPRYAPFPKLVLAERGETKSGGSEVIDHE
jgi:hypothetical protein